MKQNISVVIVAGGRGTRMKSDTPKQYMVLGGKTVAEHSFDLFLEMAEVKEVVVVCAEEYRPFFERKGCNKRIAFAEPGARRQDSVYSGLCELNSEETLVCVHDAARPCIEETGVRAVFAAADECGAAFLGLPSKYTLKQCDEDGVVVQTLDRSVVWEAQTPQVVQRSVLSLGLERALREGITVTDDAAAAELAGCPVRCVRGAEANIKITTPEDLVFVEGFIRGKTAPGGVCV
jgi:2-C-methyl-D-erythritol 4-phosphate cytidylyltransferase